MKSVHVIPGSGDRFYCENCVRDTSLVRALRRAGEAVIVAPMYLPQFLDPVAGDAPVFYGGINAYLQQKSAFFRVTPRWVDSILDAGPFLRMAAKKAGSVRASGLGELTLSVMKGAEGNQAKELRRLLRWLEGEAPFDLVHLSSSLLMGIGTEIKRRFGVPIVCSLQDEDVWIDAMEDPYPRLCWETMAEGGREVEAFVAPSRFFADVMRERMRIDPARLHVVPVGVDPGETPPEASPAPPALGYLARMSRGLGLGTLADAYLELRKGGFPDLRLHLSGGATGDDGAFLEELRGRFASEGAGDAVRFFDDFDPASRKDFLRSLTLLSVPSPKPTAYGTYILEANAAGVPVVQPRLGSFPEIVEATGGGVLYDPSDADALARELGGLLGDPARLAELGRRGRESVVQRFGWDMMAGSMVGIYRAAVAGRRA